MQLKYYNKIKATASDNQLSAASQAGDNRLLPACETGEDRLINEYSF